MTSYLARWRVSGSVRLFAVVTLAVLAAIAVFGCSGSSKSDEHQYSGTLVNPARAVSDFTLTDQDGNPFRLSEQTRPVTLIYFGYTFCPDVCPTTLADLVRVKQALGDNADQVAVLMITVDPERDSADAMKRRLSVFDPEFIGLTEDEDVLQPVWEDFGVVAERVQVSDSAAGYLMNHSSFVYLVDRDLDLRLIFPFGAPPADIAADVEQLLDDMRAG